MDGWLKALVGAACVVVIAAGAIYLWGESRAYSQASAITAERQRQIDELFRFARAKPGDDEEVRKYCHLTGLRFRNIYLKDPERPGLEEVTKRCRRLGFAS